MTPNAKDIAYEMIYAGCEPEHGRFTSDLPITADVWISFVEQWLKSYDDSRFDQRVSLLLTPHSRANPTQLRKTVHERVAPEGDGGTFTASTESHLLAKLDFFQMLRLLPLTSWWRDNIADNRENGRRQFLLEDLARVLRSEAAAAELAKQVLAHVENAETVTRFKLVGKYVAEASIPASAAHLSALIRLANVAALFVGLSLLGMNELDEDEVQRRTRDASARVLAVLAKCCDPKASADKVPPLWLIACNRPAQHALQSSLRTVKADAACRVFDTGGRGVRWAVIDSGIDATHPAFARESKLHREDVSQPSRNPDNSRILKTLDFTRLALLTGGNDPENLAKLETLKQELAFYPDSKDLLARMLRLGRDLADDHMLDWGLLEPLLMVPHDAALYVPPVDKHGTHVAGILAAGWCTRHYQERGVERPAELDDIEDFLGMCPEIELLDLRVFDGAGKSDEFTILAAMQYIRYLNQSRGKQYVHGVNLSLSLRHEVRSYGCGSTPVCLECNRLVGSGVVVVAAAGNYGYDTHYGEGNLGGAYRGQSLTDPGNAEAVITVGSTHRSDPHLYGVSYFSSRGPTGDGRLKPDLVAPGEKVLSTIPDGRVATMDGTSMAAPHVSGAAALLLSRNRELMGQPDRVKRILTQSATDLGRDRTFQGHGLVDALRALQSI